MKKLDRIKLVWVSPFESLFFRQISFYITEVSGLSILKRVIESLFDYFAEFNCASLIIKKRNAVFGMLL
jgi:hypothetical protein